MKAGLVIGNGLFLLRQPVFPNSIWPLTLSTSYAPLLEQSPPDPFIDPFSRQHHSEYLPHLV